MAERKERTMTEDLRGWGGGLLLMGILHFFLPFLAAEWGIILIILGIFSLVINHRGMFIALGASLVFAGLLNLIASLDAGPGFWTAFGCMQIYWGLKEMVKFKKFGKEQLGETAIALECREGAGHGEA